MGGLDCAYLRDQFGLSFRKSNMVAQQDLHVAITLSQESSVYTVNRPLVPEIWSCKNSNRVGAVDGVRAR